MAKLKFAIGLVVLLSLLGSTVVVAAPDEVEWSRVNIPTEGRLGDWVLGSGSDVQHLTLAINGILYGYADPSGASNTLFKSIDGGYSWEDTDYDKAIAALVSSSIDADIIYVSDGSHVYKSDDAGDSFDELAAGSLDAFDFATTGEEITCLAVGYIDNEPYVFIGTANEAAGGGVYFIHDVALGGGWTDLDVGSYDVYSIACSPNFGTDSQAIAVVTDNVHTYITYNYGVISEWTRVELLDAHYASFAITAASNMCFPSDFNQTHELFVGAVGGDGGIYRADEDYAYRFDVDTDIISLDVVGELGNLQLLAGENADAEVWHSIDDGDSWDSTQKAPSGDGPTYVVMSDDFADSGKAYAATSGSESAFSYTTDGGITWNQIGLIDTSINFILDLAISPSFSYDNTLFMLTWGGEHSLWRSLDDGARWERVFTSALANVDSLSLVELSPRYNGSQVVFLAGTSNGNPAIWKSSDNGQSFDSFRTIPPPVDTWVVTSNTSLFIGRHDSGDGLVYQTTNNGLDYSSAVVGSQPLSSIVLSPDYDEDETILVGNSNGWVYWSDDNGASFEPLPPEATSPPLTGVITVAFDHQFSSNSTVYAASDSEGKGIYRFIIGTDTEWENIDSPAGGKLKQLRLSADGTLYATNFEPDGGIERCLNPTYSLGPTFETVTRGLDDGATLTKLWLYDNRLWATDTTNIRLMTFTDCLTQPVTLTSPPDQAPGIGTIINYEVRDVSLDWKTLSGATDYEWQLNDDADFSSPVDGGYTTASKARLPTLELATTYYWRVRATEPILSPWSDKWSFTTALGYASIAPELLNPEAGASGISLTPVFQWSDVAGADSYELIISTDASFENPTILKVGDYALPGTAWECNINLNYDTTYYWKVRAISSDTYSAWSAASAFTTESSPLPPEETEETREPPAPSPSPPSAPSPPTTTDWAKYLFGALLAAVVLLSVIILVLVRGLRRLQP
jgi:photosystem II stability/assembly factor-like uncharacterized protein